MVPAGQLGALGHRHDLGVLLGAPQGMTAEARTYAKNLEALMFPDARRVADAVRKLVA